MYRAPKTEDKIIDEALASFVGPINRDKAKPLIMASLPRAPGGQVKEGIKPEHVTDAIRRLMTKRPDIFQSPAHADEPRTFVTVDGVLTSLESMTPMERLRWINSKTHG